MNLHHLIFRVFEAVRNKVDGLVLRDRVFGKAGDLGVEVLERRFVGEAVLQLAEGREETGTEGLQGAVLPAQAEFHRKPETLEVEMGNLDIFMVIEHKAIDVLVTNRYDTRLSLYDKNH